MHLLRVYEESPKSHEEFNNRFILTIQTTRDMSVYQTKNNRRGV